MTMKLKILTYLSEYSVYILYVLSCVILSILISLLFYKTFTFILYIFICSITAFVMTVLYQFILQEWLVELNYKLGYKMYKKFKIEEKIVSNRIEKQKQERKNSFLKIEINKKQMDEISPIRGIIIKRLEDE